VYVSVHVREHVLPPYSAHILSSYSCTFSKGTTMEWLRLVKVHMLLHIPVSYMRDAYFGI